ncbi:MAG: M3 family oligoendopeptidase [Clostridiales bacterium]|nr:M3 family oligoendopeptidase [Clostridiales bacterium]
MRFSDIPYKRPDLDAIIAEYADLARKTKGAASFDEVKACVDRHEKLLSLFQTEATVAHIRKTVDTTDEFYKAENDFFDERGPEFDNAVKAFYSALYECPFPDEARSEYGELIFKKMELELKQFDPAIIPDLQEENALITRYDNLVASAKIPFRGGVYNVSQLAKFKQDPDRQTRREAYEAEGGFYASHKEELDEIYDSLVKKRTEIARKLGYSSFTDVGYLRNLRTCYGPADVRSFRDRVVRDIVPVVRKLKENQAKRIGITDGMKFWDDVCLFREGNPAPSSDANEVLAAGKRMYEEMSPETREFIDFMFENEMFDVVAKPGKQVGGYCTDLIEYESPFIFSNFNGTSDDVEVLTHEAGHAFASYMSNPIKLIEMKCPAMESAETHSMSMEFFSWKWYDLYYGDDAQRAKLAHLSGCLSFLPYGCLVDEFQHVMYDRPELTPDERNEVWLGLEKKYRPWIDFDALPFYSAGSGWQRQLHIFECPFYYIDYVLAQTVALLFWDLSQKDFEDAWKRYLAFVKCGGTLDFKGLLREARLPDPFTSDALGDVANTAMKFID